MHTKTRRYEDTTKNRSDQAVHCGNAHLPSYRTMPVLINEDPNFHFGESSNHLLASVDDYVSWGYYDQGQNNYQDGFQSPPLNWTVNTENKMQFFELVKKVTGA